MVLSRLTRPHVRRSMKHALSRSTIHNPSISYRWLYSATLLGLSFCPFALPFSGAWRKTAQADSERVPKLARRRHIAVLRRI
ncbi:hypothetical protein AAMO2058_001557000 [Amorphochlora amoebiformis]